MPILEVYLWLISILRYSGVIEISSPIETWTPQKLASKINNKKTDITHSLNSNDDAFDVSRNWVSLQMAQVLEWEAHHWRSPQSVAGVEKINVIQETT